MVLRYFYMLLRSKIPACIFLSKLLSASPGLSMSFSTVNFFLCFLWLPMIAGNQRVYDCNHAYIGADRISNVETHLFPVSMLSLHGIHCSHKLNSFTDCQGNLEFIQIMIGIV